MMDNSVENTDIELSPLYNKVEYELSRLEDDGDPLGLTQGHSIDWIGLNQDIDRLLSQGETLQVFVWKLRAGLHIEGFSSLNQYLNVIHNFISNFKDKESSLTDRETYIVGSYSSALSWFSTASFVAEIKDSKLYPEENLLIRKLFDIDIKSDDSDFPLNDVISLINRADKYFGEKELPDFQNQIKNNLGLLDNIVDYVNEHSSGYILDCRMIKDSLARLVFKINSIYELNGVSEEVLESGDDSSSRLLGEDVALVGNNLANRSLRSRREVLLVLDNLLEYFSVYEPSHPAPILIRRVRKMIGMDFESIIQELLPESEDLLRRYVGNRTTDSNSQ